MDGVIVGAPPGPHNGSGGGVPGAGAGAGVPAAGAGAGVPAAGAGAAGAPCVMVPNNGWPPRVMAVLPNTLPDNVGVGEPDPGKRLVVPGGRIQPPLSFTT